MRRQFGPFLLKHCESQKGFFDSNSIFKSPHQVYSAWRRPPASETRDQTAILDSVSRPVTLPAMGIAISPRGDMLKNRVPIYARTHRVGDQLNFCGEACSPDRDASMSRIDRRSSERRFRFQSPAYPGVDPKNAFRCFRMGRRIQWSIRHRDLQQWGGS